MSLWLWNGVLLIRTINGVTGLATSAACCCGGTPCSCEDLPSTMYLDLECPDQSWTDTITLTAISNGCPGYQCARRWEGIATLTCGTDVHIWVLCDGGDGIEDGYLYWSWDGNGAGGEPADLCTAGDYNAPGPPGGMQISTGGPWTGSIAPTTECEVCGMFMNWTLRLS